MLEAITFDLDDTLWDNQGVMARTEDGHYRWLLDQLNAWHQSRQDPPLVLEHEAGLADYLQRRQRLAVAVPERRGDFTWLRLRALESQLEDHGLPRSSALMWAAAAMNEFHRLRVQVTPHPEAVPLLQSLRQRYHLAAITNGNIHLRRQPLAEYFPVAIAAGELLAPKPDPKPFLTALARFGVSPGRAMHVGDSWEEDVVPARQLGMHAVWISERGDQALPERVERIAHIRELAELVAWYEKRGASTG